MTTDSPTNGRGIDRRRFLATAGATAVLPLFEASRAVAQASPAVQIGERTVRTCSDGNLILPLDFAFPDVPRKELQALLSAADLPTERLEPPCNVTVLEDDNRLVFFDVGSGANFMPTAGRLMETITAAGIDPAAVTDVVFTHAHPDHIWGLLDDFDEVIFPNAAYHMSRPEWDFWWADDTVDLMPEARKTFAVGARNRLEVLADSINLFDFGAEVVPGVEAVDTNGHTPGHTSYAVHGGSDSLMILGDAVTNVAVSFERPDWPSGSDQDPVRGIETRRLLLDRLAADHMQAIGFHLPDGGIGTVERKDTAYRFVKI
jgi:glyoxylase-like metal-dependent hydrolase (beta-lactamase superfamily II)